MKRNVTVVLTSIAVFSFAVSVGAMEGKAPMKVYEPTWKSLTTHKMPKWLQADKFGIYGNCGLYSILAFGNEWYATRMYNGVTKRKLGKEIRFTMEVYSKLCKVVYLLALRSQIKR